jgi:MFS family permease
MYYGWVIVLLCFLALCVNFGIRLSFGVFFEALTRSGEFGWTRADTAGVFSLSVLVQAATSAGIGLLLDKIGARVVYLAGLLLLAGGMWLTSRMDSLAEFYLAFGLVTGLGSAILGLSVHGTTVSRWFGPDRRRGLAIGMAYAGTGIGLLLLAPLLEAVIAQAGWRSGYLLLGGLALVLVPFTLLFLRGSPQIGPEAAAQPALLQRESPQRGGSTAVFWLLMLAGVASLFTLRMVTVHQVAHFVDQGVERATAAAVFGWSGLVTALSYTGFGLLSDRIGRERAFYLGGIAQLLALAMLIGLQPGAPTAYLYGYVLLWGIGEGSRSGLLTAIASDRLSGPNLGTIVGSLGAFFGLGAAIGSWAGGAIFDSSGSYVLAFGLALAATLVAMGCVGRIDGRAQRTEN